MKAQSFDEFWNTGPWQKRGKRLAQELYTQDIRTPRDEEQIRQARDNYARYCRRESWYTPMFGSTFLKNWKEWLAEKTEGQAVQTLKAELGYHLCVCCAVEHHWKCQEEVCSYPYELPCRRYVKGKLQ